MGNRFNHRTKRVVLIKVSLFHYYIVMCVGLCHYVRNHPIVKEAENSKLSTSSVHTPMEVEDPKQESTPEIEKKEETKKNKTRE